MNFKPNPTPDSDGFKIDETFVLSEEHVEVTEKRSVSKDVIEWLEVISTAVIAVVIIFCFIFRVATIDGNSMRNTLYGKNKDGEIADKVIITNLGYTPEQGDIVVISRNVENSVEGQQMSEGPIIKRVIAVGGQTVNIDFESGTVYVDGKVLEEDYLGSPTYDKYDVDFPIYIPEGYIFIMGDNRGNSMDSRDSRIGEGGLVDERYVLGRAVYRFMPFDKIGKLK